MTASYQGPTPGSTHERKSKPISTTDQSPAPLLHGTVQRSLKDLRHLQPDEVLKLQSSVGNQVVQRMLHMEQSASTLQRLPKQTSSTVGSLNRPNVGNLHQQRYQELIGDLEKDPNAKALFTFDEYKQFDKDYEKHKKREGGGELYAEGFEPSKLRKRQKNPYFEQDFSFDPKVAQDHWQQLMARIKPIQSLNNGEFKSLMAYYITSLSQNNQKKAGFALVKIIDYLDTQFGFKVSRADTKMNQEVANQIGDPDIKALQEESAKLSPEHGQLWSKLNKYIAYESAKKENGVSLESTLGAKLFDGLDFGTTGSVLGPQWTALSAHFVRGLQGTIHAHAFRGAVTASVFSSTEWPRIQIMLESGEIEKMIIHTYDFGDDGKTLVEDKKKATEITKDNYKSGVIKFLDKDSGHDMKKYWKDQTQAHESEKDRNKIAKGLRKKGKK